jgi:transposase InsO family protein
VALRQEYGFGARKLRVLLRREGKDAAEATINRIIARHELTKRQDVQGQATTRFERDTPNDLWQMDFKGPIRLGDSDDYCYPLVIEDDHSRFLRGLFALSSLQGEPTKAAIRQVLTRYGLPRQFLTDHGTPFYSNTNVHGLTHVSVDLLKQGIELVHGAVRHPQTQGKLERLNRTIQEEIYFRGRPRSLEECQQLFDRFRQIYNEVRPHESLGMEVPASRYTPSDQSYRMPPIPWPYGDHTALHRLNTQGCLEYGGQRLFVCEALARETVATYELNGALIVQFRDLLIREIRLDTRRSTAIRW